MFYIIKSYYFILAIYILLYNKINNITFCNHIKFIRLQNATFSNKQDFN